MSLLRRALLALLIPMTACSDTSSVPGSARDAGGTDTSEQPSERADAGLPAPPPDAQATDGHTPDAPPTSTGPGDWGPGDYPPDLHGQSYLELTGVLGQPGKVRGFKVHVPPSYDRDVPTPVVFAFHASNQSAALFAVEGIALPQKSDEAGFIAVMPNGIQEDGFGGSWNAGTCCGEASKQGLDDVGLTRAILREVGAHLNVDLTRVYALGLSTGADFSHRLACEASDVFAAIAPLAGSICTPELAAEPGNDATAFTVCAPERSVPVLAMHGTADPFVPYASFARTLDAWAARNGCSLVTEPALSPVSAGDTTCVTYVGCPAGVEVTGCSVAEGGHCWFGSESCGTGAPLIGNLVVGKNSDTLDANDAAWAFLSRFSRPR